MLAAIAADVIGADDLHRPSLGLHRACFVHQKPHAIGLEPRAHFVGGLVIVVAEDGEALSRQLAQGREGLGQGPRRRVALHGEKVTCEKDQIRIPSKQLLDDTSKPANGLPGPEMGVRDLNHA